MWKPEDNEMFKMYAENLPIKNFILNENILWKYEGDIQMFSEGKKKGLRVFVNSRTA